MSNEWKISGCWNASFLRTAATATSCRTFVFLAFLLISAGQTAEAQTETVLYNFTGAADGANPFAGLIQDRNGNLYGTTDYGGIAGGCFGYGCGTVFELTPAGVFKVLHTFSGGADGGIPLGGLIQDERGDLYGTTSYGASFYDGTVFAIARDGTLRVLHTFTGAPDGANSNAGLVRDALGNFFGTTSSGGTFGTVFQVTPSGRERILHSFGGVPDGWFPYAGLVRDGNGHLYGTTYQGGAHGWGSIFEVSVTGRETVLYSFMGTEDGAFPVGGLTQDGKGNLYGTTVYTGGFSGYGNVFEVTSSGTENVLYRFSGADGAYPQGVLIQDAHGNFYGTTPQGGAFGYGTVFELTAAGTETVLYNFTGGADGSYPRAGLFRDPQGNFYGTTQYGGTFRYGTVFKVIP